MFIEETALRGLCGNIRSGVQKGGGTVSLSNYVGGEHPTKIVLKDARGPNQELAPGRYPN